MHNNYFFLRKLTESLGPALVGSKIEAVYSQNRNELIFECAPAQSGTLYIRASVDPAFPCLSFPEVLHRARRNSIDIFGEVIGVRISAIVQIAYDRSFYIETENDHKILFKMHGNRSNILLFKGQRCIKIFRNKLASDRDLHLQDLQGRVNLDKEAFLAAGGNFRRLAPVFGEAFDTYFAERAYGDQSTEHQWVIFRSLLDHLQNPDYCISNQHGMPVFRLYRDKATKGCFDGPMDGINAFYTQYTKIRHSALARNDARAYLSAAIGRTKGYIAKTTQKLEQLRHGRRYDQWADIIMANLHQIPAYSEQATLHDFYNDCEVNIPLKKQWTPQENAGQYYRKSKNQAIEIEQLQRNVDARKKALNELEAALQAVEELTSAKDIKTLMQRVRGDDSAAREGGADNFHRYSAGGWSILVGKNYRTNELLTFGIANKNDYWLHVKDAPGSHVVVRRPGNTNAPKHVLEYAASLAAYHSRRKNEAVVPVTITVKKYVRKGKGLKPGEVRIDREEALLVEPARNPKK